MRNTPDDSGQEGKQKDADTVLIEPDMQLDSVLIIIATTRCDRIARILRVICDLKLNR
jgi:hypothetical protein